MDKSRLVNGKFTQEEFKTAIESQGYALVENVISESLLSRIKPQLENAIDEEAQKFYHKGHKDYGMLIACPIYGGAFLEMADHRSLMQPFEWILGDTCIIYVYTSSSMPPLSQNYSARIHVDRPHFIRNYTEALGCIVMLDDFTEENGATWVLPGSHKQEEKPEEDYFYKNAIRITGKKGSVFYFNLRLWHAGGQNRTDSWRHSLGIGMIRPHLKQRIDLPRAMANVDISGISDFGLQKLGFFSQPPASLEQYYAPQEQRTYKQRSEWDKKE